MLERIRQYSSPFGDGNQRLAHYFADGLEARLAGTASQPHKMTSSSDYLRAHRLFRASSSFRKISSFACNETILVRSKKATRIHIIDFGILYGIQWPSFIRRVAGREGQKLRITGIEFPHTAGIIEDTGRRLASYAESFGVPFEYEAIAREWETIKVQDLKIEKGEFVVVVCSLRSMKLLDELQDVYLPKCPRVMFVELIREISPDIFIHGILNGNYNQPFFMNRFRDLLNHFLCVFDILESCVARDKPERMVIERDLLGKEILNVIACEGSGRVERPETYKQWQVRHVKAGFVGVPFQKNLMNSIICKVNDFYHKDFSISRKSLADDELERADSICNILLGTCSLRNPCYQCCFC